MIFDCDIIVTTGQDQEEQKLCIAFWLFISHLDTLEKLQNVDYQQQHKSDFASNQAYSVPNDMYQQQRFNDQSNFELSQDLYEGNDSSKNFS